MKTVVGIDNGTQSTKVLFYHYETKQIVAKASAPHDLRSKSDGTREQEASWWLEALQACFDQIDPAIKQTAIAMGVSGQQHGFVPVAQDGTVLAPVKLWCDTSTAKECQQITQTFGGKERLIKEVGNPILPGYTASKILHFKQTNPTGYAKMAYVMLPHDYLNYYLTGKVAMEPGDASGTGLLHIASRQWHKELACTIDPSLIEKLPPLKQSNETMGTLLPERARQYNLPVGIPVAMGGGDNMMGAIGTGSLTEGDATMSMGTSGTLFATTPTPLIDPQGEMAAFCSSSGSWLPLYCTMNCTVSSELTRGLFDVDVKTIDTLAATANPGADGITLVPFFNGERSPNLPQATGSLHGLRQDNFTRANIARAAMEASVFGLKRGLDTFVRLGYSPKRIRLIGGGANSAPWRQMVADIFGLPVVVPKSTEAPAMGAALQALACVSETSVAELAEKHVELDAGKSTQPDHEAVAIYKEVYQRYATLVDTLIAEHNLCNNK